MGWWLLVVGLLVRPGLAGEKGAADPVELGTRQIRTWFSSMVELRPSDQPPVWLHEPLVVQDGPITLTLDDGYLVPVHSGRTEVEWASEEHKPFERGDRLTAVRDDTGTFDARLQTSVLCLYRAARDDRDDEDAFRRGVEVIRLHVSGEAFPTSDPVDPDSPPAPTARLESRRAEIRATPRTSSARMRPTRS